MDDCQNDVVFIKMQHFSTKKLGFPAKSKIYLNYMGHFLKVQTIIDNGGSRCGSDRHQHTIKGYAPDRRLGIWNNFDSFVSKRYAIFSYWKNTSAILEILCIE
jgi:hypothetical protein